ncbi:MAG: M23 family metallopeptidase [Clostridia bacterium]|nr:M23 family metallopeptidase [Clostridia bacterium]
MDDNFNEFKNKLINSVKKIVKKLFTKVFMKIVIPIILIIVMLGGSIYILTLDDAEAKENDISNAPYAASTYTDSASVGNDGQLSTSKTVQELWDEMDKSNSRVSLYLDTPEELMKLMNAELVTNYVDTRKNPDEPIDWDSGALNDVDSKDVQGIIKLKRSDEDGNNQTMTYVDPETFQRYIDNYNSTGSEADKNKALSHFTLETVTSSDSGQAQTITAGTTIKIPTGFGSVHTYMGWQLITSPSSTQYVLREQAGMNFDDEGFAKINNRYVIACTTTYGSVGDYIDFYQDDGTVIPCIIGDIKNQNDAGCNKWGHQNGHCIVEFVVDKRTWYNSNHANPGTSRCHPEWNKNLTKAVNGGSYFDNPNFGTDSITENNADTDTDTNTSGEMNTMKWPTDGTNVTSQFGLRSAPTAGASTEHRGIDIGIPEGTNVYACEAGKVTIASYSESAGNWVVIDHGNGYVSKYMHNKELKVSVGDKVEKGQVIALSGNTGISTGPHLHFQIENEGSAIDPLLFKYENGMGNGNEGIGSNSDGSTSGYTTKYCAKVATWSEQRTTITSTDSSIEPSDVINYNMMTTNINYQDMVKGYTMPFEYLWALLVITEDKDFVLELADLVYNSEIEITVHDNLTVTTDVEVNTYTKKERTDTNAEVFVNYGKTTTFMDGSSTESGEWTDEKSENCEVKKTVINKDNTLDISLTKANVWMLEYTQEYTHEKPETTTTTNSEDLEDQDYPDKPDSTSQDDTYGHAQNLLETELKKYEETYDYVGGRVLSIESKIYNAVVNRKRETSYTTETTNYVASPANTREKTDNNENEANFVTILLKSEHTGARRYISEIPSWLFEILESNDSTVDMVDLTKYLLYKATGKNYGVTEYDFSQYVYTELSDYSSSTKDYIVKTNDQNSATVVKDKEKLEQGLKKWLKNASKQKSNALSVIDEVLECQEKYHVNAVFIYAFLRNETGIGTADTDYVKKDNNWGSWNLGHEFSSPEENIETIARNIENGNIYFTQGRITVSAIAEEYCPNTEDYPTQCDKWIEDVQNYMADLYGCMGIVETAKGAGSVAKGGAGTIGVYTSSTGQKYNLYLQGSGAPWANEDYGNSHSMAKAGCGPTAEAIIASAYDANITPSTARKDIINKFGTGNNSSASCIAKSLNSLVPGVKTSVGKFDKDRIKRCLKNSGQVWLVVRSCKYTSNAHCIALIDYKDSGKVYVAHGTAKTRPYGWDNLSYIESYNKYADVLYVGGQ